MDCGTQFRTVAFHKGTVGQSLLGPIHILDDEQNEVPVGGGTIYFEGLLLTVFLTIMIKKKLKELLRNKVIQH